MNMETSRETGPGIDVLDQSRKARAANLGALTFLIPTLRLKFFSDIDGATIAVILDCAESSACCSQISPALLVYGTR